MSVCSKLPSLKIFSNVAINLKATESQIVAARTVLADLNDTEESEAVLIWVRGLETLIFIRILLADRSLIDVRVDAPG